MTTRHTMAADGPTGINRRGLVRVAPPSSFWPGSGRFANLRGRRWLAHERCPGLPGTGRTRGTVFQRHGYPEIEGSLPGSHGQRAIRALDRVGSDEAEHRDFPPLEIHPVGIFAV